MDFIEFSTSISLSTENKELLMSVLPKRPTKVLEVREGKLFYVTLYTACKDINEIKSWILDFEEATSSAFSIRSTSRNTGRYVLFKQILTCVRKTRSKETLNSLKARTRNTNCPAILNITLHAVKKRFQGKNLNIYQLRRQMPCEITMMLSHNHPPDMQYLKVSNENVARLRRLFEDGHRPGSALTILKSELNVDKKGVFDSINGLAPTYPSYMFCYHLYKKEFFGRKFESSAKICEYLTKKLDRFNEQTDGNSARAIVDGENYIMCYCPPIFKRAHKRLKSSGETVYVSSWNMSDSDNAAGKMVIFSTNVSDDLVPLAIIVTSRQKAKDMSLAFSMLEDMAGPFLFFCQKGGPKRFIIDNSEILKETISQKWQQSQIYLSTFDVLKTIWLWLVEPKNGIPFDKQNTCFQAFKAIIYANNKDECHDKYEKAMAEAKDFEEYCSFLKCYWHKRELWALAYRYDFFGECSEILSENYARVIQKKMFSGAKQSCIRTLDILFNKLKSYQERRLLDMVNDNIEENQFNRAFRTPPDDIQIISDNILLVPNEISNCPNYTVYFTVNLDVLVCLCSINNAQFCDHVDWAAESFLFQKIPPVEHETKLVLHAIATGLDFESKLVRLRDNTLENVSVFPSTEELRREEETEEDWEVSTSNSIFPTNENEGNVIIIEHIESAEDESWERGQAAIKRLSEIFTYFLAAHPIQAADGLSLMLAKAECLPTVENFADACSSFASEKWSEEKSQARSPQKKRRKEKK